MEEQKASSSKIRPTKKQKELLTFIEQFIESKGYSPSYREIMQGLNYTSVATIALHVNNLIKRGHLAKRDRSARSLEVVGQQGSSQPKITPKQLRASEEKWLVDKIDVYFKDLEEAAKVGQTELDQLYVLVGALKVLGVGGAAQAFMPRLNQLKKRTKGNEFIT